jgi:16S rRNA (cytosine1402-N4)-methyltransferase
VLHVGHENRDINTDIEHISVLSEKLAELISIPKDGVMVDATLGHGGHSFLFGKTLGPCGLLLGMDVDQNCINRAQMILDSLQCRVMTVRENFSKIEDVLTEKGVGKVDFILADLGFCSAQLGNSERGLSFQENMPIDMRLDCRNTLKAADIINDYKESDLADVLYEYGQERASRRIARFIVDYRRHQKIKTTAQRAALVCRALNQPVQGRRVVKTHPATKTFQALRIAVNRELDNLKILLESAPKLLKSGGKVAIISFHSLEDKIVKENFKLNKKDRVYEIITPKPVEANKQEIKCNPRARSAKLRIASCI